MENKNQNCTAFGSEHVAEKLNFITKQSRKMMTGQYTPFAEDMAMDSVEKALKHVENFKGSEAQFNAWLKQIVKNTCTDFLRRKKTIRTTDGDIVAFSDKKSKVFTENDTSKVDGEKASLKKALKLLDDKTKEILFLKHYYNCSGREISCYLGIKELHVSVYHARAIKTLKNEMTRLNY
jgi:RNA polymerase sigma factor (sigma-70 family)